MGPPPSVRQDIVSGTNICPILYLWVFLRGEYVHHVSKRVFVRERILAYSSEHEPNDYEYILELEYVLVRGVAIRQGQSRLCISAGCKKSNGQQKHGFYGWRHGRSMRPTVEIRKSHNANNMRPHVHF